MPLIRIADVKTLDDFHVELTLTTGKVIQRDLRPLLTGPAFESVRSDPTEFRRVRAEDGTVVWPGGADLCPDVVIWGGLPPSDSCESAA
jgi:hypothetical protein